MNFIVNVVIDFTKKPWAIDDSGGIAIIEQLRYERTGGLFWRDPQLHHVQSHEPLFRVCDPGRLWWPCGGTDGG